MRTSIAAAASGPYPAAGWRAFVSSVLVALVATGGKVERKAAELNRDATDAYEAEQFEDAAALYSDALTQAPESPDISYNLGNALYRNKRLEDAMSNLSRAAQVEDPALRHDALHNLGNTLFRMGKLPEAVDAYRRALEADPTDLDTKINFEKALSLLEEQEQQEDQQQQDQQQQDQQNQEQGQENQDGQQEQQQDQQEQSEQEPQSQDEQDEQGESESESGSEEQEPQPTDEQQPGVEEVAEGELRYEEALRILEAMRDQEKEQQKARARKLRANAKRSGKDW